MRKAVLPILAILAALAAAAIDASPAGADVIDFDPRTDAIPEILTPEEMEKWEALRRGGGRPTVSDITPDGSLALVNSGGLKVLVVDTGELVDLVLGDWSMQGSIFWTGDTEGVVLVAQPGMPPTYAKMTLDLATRTFETAEFTPTAPAGRNLSVRPGQLFQLPDGSFHTRGFTVPAGATVETVELPEFDALGPQVQFDLKPEPDTYVQATSQVVIISLEDGTVMDVGPVPAGLSLNGAAGSLSQRPGTTEFAFVTNTSIPWIGENINGRSARGGGMPTGYIGTRDGLGRLPEAENPHMLSTTLYMADVASGERKQFSALDGPNLSKFGGSFWTADGSLLVVPSNLPARLEGRMYGIYGYTGATALELFSPAGEHVGTWSHPLMSAPGNAGFTPLYDTKVLVQYGANLTYHVAVVDIADQDAAPTMIYDGDERLHSFATAGSVLVTSLSNAGDPGELYVGRPAADGTLSDFTAVTNANEAQRALANVAYEPIEYETSAGYTLRGAYIYPADWTYPPPEPMPVVVWQLGGPGGQMYNQWGASVESPYTLLPAFGIPVFMVNGSGRLSNGATFYTDMADGDNYGQRDIRDVKEGVDHLIAAGVVDPDAVGVTGCSYGGYFTLQSLVEFPDFYAAGNSQCSLNDLMYEYNFGWAPFLAYLVGDSPTGNTAEYLRDSPTYRAHEIKAPLLQFHGTWDFLFFEHITNIHDQVEANGVPSRFFRGIGYGHGIGNITGVEDAGTKGQRYAFQLQLQWFREHLGMATAFSAAEWIDALLRPILAPITPSPVPGPGPIPGLGPWPEAGAGSIVTGAAR